MRNNIVSLFVTLVELIPAVRAASSSPESQRNNSRKKKPPFPFQNVRSKVFFWRTDTKQEMGQGMRIVQYDRAGNERNAK
jgi:hypothetical protein